MNANTDTNAVPPGAPTEDGTSKRGRTGFAALTREELLARAADLRGFAGRVFDAFRESKRPLAQADHKDLNALARAAFVLGRDAAAAEAFALMRARGIRSDLHDLNVALAAVAKANPASGAARLRTMIEGGLKPDAVSFGTVVHWAIFHGDVPLVGEVLRLARAHGVERLSFKTMGSILGAGGRAEFDAGASPAARLPRNPPVARAWR